MTHPTLRRRLSAAAVTAALAALPVLCGADAPPADPAIEPAISRPVVEAKLAFPAPGIVADVLVHEGDHVTVGQVLAKQDDAEEQEALASLKLAADSMAEVNYERLDLAQKVVAQKRKQSLFDEGGVASQSELDDANLAVKLASAQVLVAEQKHDTAGHDAKKEQIKIDRMELRSKVDGIVSRVVTHAGEMADPSNKDGAIDVVKNDPIWIEIHPSTDRALKLTKGQELQVRYATPAGESPAPWQPAKIIYFAPQADASSKTELVRLELPNPNGQVTGLAMEVRLPAAAAAVAATPAGPTAMPPLAN